MQNIFSVNRSIFIDCQLLTNNYCPFWPSFCPAKVLILKYIEIVFSQKTTIFDTYW